MSTGICAHCVSGSTLPGEPTGAFHDGAYFHPASSQLTSGEEATTTSSKRAVVLLTDAFGLPLKNCKLLADKYSERLGCDVWVPDIFNGTPVLKESALVDAMPQVPNQSIPFTVRLKFWVLMLSLLPGVIANRPAVLDPRIEAFVKKIKDEQKYDRIGVVGFCMGGAATIRLASKNLITSAVVCHPGPCSVTEIKAMKVPTSWVCAEEDQWFGPKIRREAEAIFAGRKDKPGFVDYEFHDYKGTIHGFAARPNFAYPDVKRGFEGAFEQTVGWFEKTL